MLVTQPENRIDAAQALNHKFLTTSFQKKKTQKDSVFKSLQTEWFDLLLKDQLKSFISFYLSQE